MKWQGPKNKEFKLEKRFAWLPVRMSNGAVLWLESYYTVEKFNDLQGGWFMSYWYKSVIFAERDNENLLAYWKQEVFKKNRGL